MTSTGTTTGPHATTSTTGATIRKAQSLLAQRGLDLWLVHDFRGSNAALALLLGAARSTTRRVMLLIPRQGDATLLCSVLDANQFSTLPQGVVRKTYVGWREMHDALRSHLAGARRVAMEYAPGCTLPVVSVVDAGTVELVRSMGVEVASSADVLQLCVATWDEQAQANHARASEVTARAKDAAFSLIRGALAGNRPITEADAQRAIVEVFQREGLEMGDLPIVAVNEHSGDPHFEVDHKNPAPIRPGDWVLIDLWARVPGNQNVFSDITWVAYCGKRVPEQHAKVAGLVMRARDASLELARRAWSQGRTLQGWELDDAAREVLLASEFKQFIAHRTGHSLSPGPKVHGLGVNLDNLETRDTREVVGGLGYTIEPGLYLPAFGVRSEINVFTDPQRGPVVTSCLQEHIELLA